MMRKLYQSVMSVVVVAMCLMVAGRILAGSLDPTNAPGPTMHTLEEIYQKVRNLAPQTLQTLSSNTAVVDGGYYAATNLTQVDANLAAENIVKDIGIFGVTGTALIATGNATEAQVLEGSTFSKTGANGLTGTMTDRGAVAIAPGATPESIPQGYHNGSGSVSGDVNLVTGNIKAGTSIFGVAGKSSVVETASGTAVASDMLASKTAYVNGALVTGAMVSRTLSSNTTVVSGGYYAATNLTQVEGDLVAGNIVKDIGIFGVTGTALVATGKATEAQVLVGSTFSRTGANGLTGTMTDRGAVAIMPGTTPQAIPQGYHSGSGSVSGDVNLVTGNIKAGTSIFGVAGKSSVVETVSGTAVASDMLASKTAYVNGALVTGAMVSQTLSSNTAVVNAGYYAATNLMQVEADLVAGNIATNVTIFGVVGTRSTYFAAVPKTGQTTLYATGDDGSLKKGVALPSPRFTDNSNGTVKDNLTGLIWLKKANAFSTRTWAQALTACNTLSNGTAGAVLTDNSVAGDWRLPNAKELYSLIDLGRTSPALPSGHPFTGVQSDVYWSSSTISGFTDYAWFVSLVNGYVYYDLKSYTSFVWPVRGGQ